MKISSYLLILCIFALSLYVGCDRDGIVSPENNPPEIESIISTPSSSLTNRIAGGTSVQLSVKAIDPDGDDLFFMWEAEHGQFDGEVNKSTVQWTSPVVESEMDCLIKVSVSDGFLTVQGNITLHIDKFVVPTVTTFEITDFTETTAVGGGEIIDTGGSDIVAFGLVWSKSPDPTLEENDGYTADSTAAGTFTHEITGLEPNTEYHLKAYATNNAGSAYGAQVLFSTRLAQYNISGRVTEHDTGLAEVTITASGGFSHTVSTNSDGEYTISGVPQGTDITITPDRTDYDFSPKSRSISNISEDHTGIDFVGTLATSASISVNPTSLDYGDVVANQNARSRTFTVQNTGTAAMSGQISLTGEHADQYTITSGGGSYTINAGQSRSVTVRFNPTSTGRKEATLRITHNAGNTASPVDVTLRGDGVAAATASITVNPTSLDYGDVVANQNARSRTFTIQNTGTASMSGQISLTGEHANQYTITSGGGSYTINAGQSRSVTVRFNPTSTGRKEATLRITHNAGNTSSPLDVTLQGDGVDAATASITVNPTSHDYGDVIVDQSASTTFTVQNTGTAAMSGQISLTGIAANQYTITNGGGSYTINAGQSRSVTVRFNPTSTGRKEAMLRITHDAANTSSPIHMTLRGDGVAAATASITINPTSHDYGDVIVDQSASLTFTVQNTGTASMSGQISLTGTAANQYTITSGGGSYTINAGQSRSVTVRFNPTSTGRKEATLRITHDAGNTASPVDVTLRGDGVAAPTASITVNPTSHDYGDVIVDQSASTTFTVQNTGTAAMSGQISLTGTAANQYTITSGGGSYTINAGQSRSVTVRFNPTSTGRKEATLRITHDAANTSSPVDVTLRGDGVAAPTASITVNPASHDYGDVVVNQNASMTFTVQNTGTASMSGQISLTGTAADQYTITSGGGSYTINAGQSRSVTVRFNPTSTGRKEATLRITHNAGNTASPVDVTLRGDGVAAPTASITVNPASHDYGDVIVSQNASMTFTVQNTGTAAMSGQISLTGTAANQYTITSGGGSYTINAGQSRSVTVRFNPTSTGRKEATLRITHNAGNTASPVDVTLRGDGVAAPTASITVNPASHDYGDVIVSQNASMTFTVQNTGTAAMSGQISLTGTAANQYTITSGGGSYTINAGQSRSVTVRFNPTSTGRKEATLRITHDAANTASPVDVTLRGDGITASYNISGRVTEGGSGLGGIRITVSGGHSAEAMTSFTGDYFMTGVPHGATVTITPSYTGYAYAFDPPSRTLSNITQHQTGIDFTAGPLTEPAISVNPTNLDFGEVLVDEIGSQLFTITNTGTADLEVVVYVYHSNDDDDFRILNGGGGYTLDPGSSRNVQVLFEPKTGGRFENSIRINHNATNTSSPVWVNLLGFGREVYDISGRVTKPGPDGPFPIVVGLSGARITASGGHTQTVYTDNSGYYTITRVPDGETVTITPSYPDYSFEPQSRVISNISQDQTGVNFFATEN